MTPAWSSRLRRLAAASLLAWPLMATQAGPVPWPDAPYSYFANNASLDTVLGEFAGGFSLSLSLGPGVAGTVNGKFTSKNATEFITRLGGVYGFTWYVHAGTLFVSRASDLTTRAISTSSGSISQMRQALTDLGVLEPRFGWGELAEQGVALVSGPASYVALVEETVRNLPQLSGGQQVAVFRLRHAAVEDRTIAYRDKEITTPGLATVLRNLISGTGGAGRSTANSEALSSVLSPLRAAQPLVAEPQAGSVSGGALFASGASATGVRVQGVSGSNLGPTGNGPASAAVLPQRVRQPSIQSDPRLNAIIVQDIPERLPLYEKLIAQLDVPTALIEIEAMIIDVNTQRLEELGINWGGRDGRVAAGFGRVDNAATNTTLSLVRGPTGSSVNPTTLVVDAGNYLVSQIRALEGKGDARILSRPSVLTVDNIGAMLDLSETLYIRTQGERVATVTPVTAGTSLRVTPRVIENGQERVVQLVVDIEDGQIQDRLIDTLPTVRRSNVSTQAIVLENETLLIGGYNTDQNIERVDRVPLLGEIPVVGALFSNKTRDVQKRERLFMIKPKIVSLPSAGSAGVGGAPLSRVTPAPIPKPTPASPELGTPGQPRL